MHDRHLGSNGRNIENIDLRLSEILSGYLIDRQHMSATVTGDKYCIFGRVQGAVENSLLCWTIEFGKLVCEIWKNLSWKTAVPNYELKWMYDVILSSNLTISSATMTLHSFSYPVLHVSLLFLLVKW